MPRTHPATGHRLMDPAKTVFVQTGAPLVVRFEPAGVQADGGRDQLWHPTMIFDRRRSNSG
jgi:hypothetical protein